MLVTLTGLQIVNRLWGKGRRVPCIVFADVRVSKVLHDDTRTTMEGNIQMYCPVERDDDKYDQVQVAQML